MRTLFQVQEKDNEQFSILDDPGPVLHRVEAYESEAQDAEKWDFAQVSGE